MKDANGHKTVTLWAYDLVTGRSFQWGDLERLPRLPDSDTDPSQQVLDDTNGILLDDSGTALAVITTGGWSGPHLAVLLQCKLPTGQARVVGTAQDVTWLPLMREGNDLWIRQEKETGLTPQGNRTGNVSLIRVDLVSGTLETFIADSQLGRWQAYLIDS